MKLKVTEPAFFERYAQFAGYGYGCMLVYFDGRSLEYVLFSPIDSLKKTVVNKDLLDKYKKEATNE
jgi:hypothetical protein